MMTDTPVPPQPAEPQHAAQFPTAAVFPPSIAHMFPMQGPMPTFQAPVFMPVSMAPIPILDHTGIFLAGFRDCAAEAIKYLTESEQMSEDDPAIQGLRQHLCTRQDTLKNSSTPSSPNGKLDFSDTSKDTHSTSPNQNDSLTDEGYSSILQDFNKNSTPIHTSFPSSHSGQFSSSCGHYPIIPVFSMTSLTASPIVSDVTSCVTSPLMSSSVISGGSHIDSLVETQSSTLDSPKELPDLAVLAQSNPAIAYVAKELMDLLEEEFDEGLTDCEEGEEEKEDMEEEENERSS